MDYRCLFFCCDWLGSDIQIGHFLSFCCPLVNTPQLNTELSHECQMIDSLTTELSWSELTSTRTEYRSPSPTIRVLLFYPLPRKCLVSRYLAMDFGVCSLPRESVTDPLPSDGHIRHNIKGSIFWDITPCHSVKVNWRFRGIRRLHLLKDRPRVSHSGDYEEMRLAA
jgi:hypothetical protein